MSCQLNDTGCTEDKHNFWGQILKPQLKWWGMDMTGLWQQNDTRDKEPADSEACMWYGKHVVSLRYLALFKQPFHHLMWVILTMPWKCSFQLYILLCGIPLGEIPLALSSSPPAMRLFYAIVRESRKTTLDFQDHSDLPHSLSASVPDPYDVPYKKLNELISRSEVLAIQSSPVTVTRVTVTQYGYSDTFLASIGSTLQ